MDEDADRFLTGINYRNLFHHRNGIKHVYGVGRDVYEGEMAADADALRAQIARLCEAYGVHMQGGYYNIDISYPNLQRYAERVVTEAVGAHPDLKSKLTVPLKAIVDASGAGLVQLAMDTLFEVVGGLTERQLEPELLRLAGNITGEQRIKSLLVIKLLIDNDLGCIGSSYYRGKKLKIRLTQEGEKVDEKGIAGVYDWRPHTIAFKRKLASDYALYRSDRWTETGDHILIHELSHAYHHMLGIPLSLSTNSMNAAITSDPRIMAYMCPLVNKEAFQDMVKTISRDGWICNAIGNPDTENVFGYEGGNNVLAFLVEHSLIPKREELGLQPLEDTVYQAVAHLAVQLIVGWSNPEEALTIYGFTPLIVNTRSGIKRFSIIDRQNESTYHVRNTGGMRLLHKTISDFGEVASVSFSVNKDTLAKKIAEALDSVMKRHNVQAYLPTDEMVGTEVVVYRQNMRRYQKDDELIRELVRDWETSVPAGEDHEDNYGDMMLFAARWGATISEDEVRGAILSNKIKPNMLRAYLNQGGVAAKRLGGMISAAYFRRRGALKPQTVEALMEATKYIDGVRAHVIKLMIDYGYIGIVAKSCVANNAKLLQKDELVAGLGRAVTRGVAVDLEHAFLYAARYLVSEKDKIPDEELGKIVNKLLEKPDNIPITQAMRYASTIKAKIDCSAGIVARLRRARFDDAYHILRHCAQYVDFNYVVTRLIEEDCGQGLKTILDSIQFFEFDHDGTKRIGAVQWCIKTRKMNCIYKTFPTRYIEYSAEDLEWILKTAIEKDEFEDEEARIMDMLEYPVGDEMVDNICTWISAQNECEEHIYDWLETLKKSGRDRDGTRRKRIIQTYVGDGNMVGVSATFPAEGVTYDPRTLGLLIKHRASEVSGIEEVFDHARENNIGVESSKVDEACKIIEQNKELWQFDYIRARRALDTCKAYLNRVGHKRPVAAP
jgi:hypothetical protein